MSDETIEASGPSPPDPSPEVQQLAMLGQLEDAVRLYAKQAEVDEPTARAVVEPLAE
jgi:hypothetical protein